jgi:hypothetical protein
MYRKRLLIFVLTFLISIATVFADPGDGVPCSGEPDDPGYDPNGCNLPLDTWVCILVFAALIVGVYRLHQKHKKLALNTNC